MIPCSPVTGLALVVHAVIIVAHKARAYYQSLRTEGVSMVPTNPLRDRKEI